MNRTFFALATTAALSILACEKSGSEVQKEANKAASEANKDINSATSEANTKITNAQVEAEKKMGDVQKDFAKAREDYRHDMQTNIDNIDKKLTELDAKAKKATGKAKADLDTNLTGLHARRDALVADMKSIENSTAVTWDSTKARLDKEWTDLKTSVDKVD